MTLDEQLLKTQPRLARNKRASRENKGSNQRENLKLKYLRGEG